MWFLNEFFTSEYEKHPLSAQYERIFVEGEEMYQMRNEAKITNATQEKHTAIKWRLLLHFFLSHRHLHTCYFFGTT